MIRRGTKSNELEKLYIIYYEMKHDDQKTFVFDEELLIQSLLEIYIIFLDCFLPEYRLRVNLRMLREQGLWKNLYPRKATFVDSFGLNRWLYC